MITIAGGIILALVVLALFDNIGAWIISGCKRPWWLVVLFLVAPVAARAQASNYLTLVEVTEPVARQMAAAYRPADPEQMWCVTAYETEEHDTYRLLRVTSVERVRAKAALHHVYLAGGECTTPAGVAQPTIHTHTEANCQYSPADVAQFLKRDAAFDGIQCGGRAKVWYFAWQLRAAFRPDVAAGQE